MSQKALFLVYILQVSFLSCASSSRNNAISSSAAVVFNNSDPHSKAESIWGWLVGDAGKI